jgi:hypothetical protein
MIIGRKGVQQGRRLVKREGRVAGTGMIPPLTLKRVMQRSLGRIKLN